MTFADDAGRKMEKQVLVVWNPYYEPQTIRVHYDILTEDRKPYVWWGWMEAPERQAQDYGHIVEIDREMREDKRELLLFVTDFSTVHALRVDKITFGDLPESESDKTPRYYRDSDLHTKLWFRVADIRIIARSPDESVHSFMEDQFTFGAIVAPEGELVGSPYTPYLSAATPYPLVVEAVRTERLFSSESLAEGRYVDNPENVIPTHLQKAEQRIRRSLSYLWGLLESKAQQQLVRALSESEFLKDEPRDEFTGPFARVCNAVESELCRRIFVPSSRANRKVQRLLFNRCTKRPSMGSMIRFLEMDVGQLHGHLPESLENLSKDNEFIEWLSKFANQRNDVLHARKTIGKTRYQEAWDDVFRKGGHFFNFLHRTQGLTGD